MYTYLRHDDESRELRLVMTDYYDGKHERTEFTVVNADSEPIHSRPEFDGLRVHRDGLDHFVRLPASGIRVNVRTMPGQRSQAERTECPKAVNRRRKCSLCAALAA